MWITTILTVSGFSFGPKLGAIFGVLCFCSDTDFIFFSGTNFFLGFLTKQQNSWKWFSQLFVSSWESCFKGKLIGKKICILISDCVKMSSLTSWKVFSWGRTGERTQFILISDCCFLKKGFYANKILYYAEIFM